MVVAPEMVTGAVVTRSIFPFRTTTYALRVDAPRPSSNVPA